MRTQQVKIEPGYTEWRRFIGSVTPARRTGAGFELAGKVTQVHVEEGDQIEAGSLLATLDTERLQARRGELQQAVASAAARAELAESTYHRVETAERQRGASAQDLDEARQTLAARRAELRQTQAALHTIDVDLAKSELHAPFRGIVTGRFADEGQVIQAGTPLIELIEQRKPEVRIGLGGTAPVLLTEGDRHTVTIGTGEYPAVVRTVLPVRNDGTRTVDAILTLETDLAGDVRSGDVASLRLPSRTEEQGFWLPLQALTESARGLWAVYVVEALTAPSQATHIVGRRELEVLHQRGNEAFARGTLEDGARIVAAGIHRLSPGMHVRIEESDAGPGAEP